MDPGKLLTRSNRDATADAAAQAEFNEKRRVWIPDTLEGFLPGWIKSQKGDDGDPSSTAEVVISTTGEVRNIPVHQLCPMNPPQFDGVNDIADLTHLNEASVINNLKLRYGSGSIYTYSGLFLISLNPYRPLPIYTPRIIAQYRTKRREENAPHIFAVAERAWQQIGEERESQSILITGESGAGKTENTKKVIQYLAAIASSSIPTSSFPSSSSSSSIATAPSTGLPRSSSFKGKEAQEIDLYNISSPNGQALGLLERQILQANPILEAFGNAQTMRNNNSSRFGKFIRIFFGPDGSIAGANIDWYLLEKSRVTKRASGERGFHVFYQLLQGAKEARLADKLLLQGGPEQYGYLKSSRKQIDGVDDLSEWRLLKEALETVGFSPSEQFELFRIPAVILHIGNLLLGGAGGDQTFFEPSSQSVAEKICHLLGIPVSEFTKTVLRPKVRAGREWVTQARTKKQAEDELGALCKFMYEKTFGRMVERINTALDRPSAKSLSIGVLDIAGFEIFDENSYEQLLINFTNEKLQQFFNFHMFTLEQEEYTREGIEWDYVNFGLDLQPTIELIESSQPIGILSCLDEECIMPKATDLTFTEKLQSMWEPPRGSAPSHPGSAKFKHTRFGKGFIVKHYAGDVEYRTEGWLEKNKDPINDALAKLLAVSEVPSVASLFSEYAEDNSVNPNQTKRVKRGAFRTVGQRHKEQLGQLMQQLSSTQPHFVRCIVPNGQKKPGKVEVNLVLDQLRCNGVLEGIRIARLGYPNRHAFSEFRQRYEVLTPGVIPTGYMDGRKAAEMMAEALDLDKAFYKIGATKIFFKAGVLADLEERRDNLLTDLFRRFQASARMHIARRRILKLINRAQAVRTIQRNARTYIALRDWPWWSLYVKVRPLLAATRSDDQLIKKQAELAMAKERAERDSAEKKRLEELKISLLAEKGKIEQDLDSERQLGQDKDRMLERSKLKESELIERIKEMENDLTVLDSQREAAIIAAESTKAQIRKLQNDFEKLLEQATMLEKEVANARIRESELLKASKEKGSAHSKLESEKLTLVRQVEDLKREVMSKEEAMKRAKERADLNVAELEKRLKLEKGKTTQVSALTEDLRKAKLQIDEIDQIAQKHQATIVAKQKEIANLESQKAAMLKAQEVSDQAKSTLAVQIEALKQTLSTREKERSTESAARQKLEKELDDLRQIMAAKSSEDIKRKEVDRSREAEMSGLRSEVVKLQKSLDDQREAQQSLANKLRVDVEGLRNSHTAAQRDLKLAQADLVAKDQELARVSAAVTVAESEARKVQGDLAAARATLASREAELRTSTQAKERLDRELQKARAEYEDLEDAVLTFEDEKAEWARNMNATTTQLADESSKRQKFEQQVYNAQVELAEYRNIASVAERDLAKAASDIRARDSEIALLRSRENKTIVEHVHVLETAKRMTDMQLAEQVQENKRLNSLLKQSEATRNRLQGDLEDAHRQAEMTRVQTGKEARKARASMSTEDKEVAMALQDEKRARQAAEAKVAALEVDLAEQKRQKSTAQLSSPSRSNTQSDSRLRQSQEELAKLTRIHHDTLAQNSRLQNDVADLSRQLAAIHNSPPLPQTPTKNQNSNRADLLRGLQQSHDALGRDMSEQLRKLDAQPLTPSRRHNHNGSNLSNGAAAAQSPDLMTTKRMRSLEMELQGLRQQLDDEREEKSFYYERMKELEAGRRPDGAPPLNYEQAMFSHFRLKAKSLRSQLDHWLAMEDLNKNAKLQSSRSGTPFTEDVQLLKQMLSEMDTDGSPFKPMRTN